MRKKLVPKIFFKCVFQIIKLHINSLSSQWNEQNKAIDKKIPK